MDWVLHEHPRGGCGHSAVLESGTLPDSYGGLKDRHTLTQISQPFGPQDTQGNCLHTGYLLCQRPSGSHVCPATPRAHSQY
jgi:hypothetical protein